MKGLKVFFWVAVLALFLGCVISGAIFFSGSHAYDIQTTTPVALSAFFALATILAVVLFFVELIVLLPILALVWLVRGIMEDERREEEEHQRMIRRIKEEMVNTPPGECHHRKPDGSLDLQCHWFGKPTCRQCGAKWDSSGYCFCPKPSFPFSLCGICKWCGSPKLDYDV